jgi:hypothetical protein
MNENSIELKSRRSILKKTAAWLAGFAMIPLLANVRHALAAGKLAKADVMYQDTPKAGKDCDDCLQFIPGATPKANGTCKVVDGVISPHGYCAAFTPKPKQG